MRVGIDVRKAADYGIGTYIRNLLVHLPPLDSSTEWVLFHRPGDENLLPQGERITLVPETSGKYSLRELWALSALARRRRLDIFHAPHYVLPFRLPCPAIVTIHDLIHLLFKEYLPHPLARYYARFMLGRAVRVASRIITATRASEKDIISRFPRARKSIHIIPHGVEKVFSPRPLPEAREWLAHSLDLKGRYLLFVGNPKRHKNLDLLFRAFARLQKTYNDLKLVVVGGNERQHKELGVRARDLGIDSRTRLLDNTDQETLDLLYSAATIFVFPSLYEGFGLPPLEAMSCGAPVASSSSSSLPEVLGPAAAYFSPESVDSLVSVLCNLLDRPDLRAWMSRRGPERAQLFSWEETARLTMGVYRQVYEESR